VSFVADKLGNHLPRIYVIIDDEDVAHGYVTLERSLMAISIPDESLISEADIRL
jgi:hypothetical protein